MTITSPLGFLMEDARFGPGCSFRLQSLSETGRTGGGLFISTNLSDPIWVADYVTTEMTHGEATALEARLHWLVANEGIFEGGDPRRQSPQNYDIADFSDTGQLRLQPADLSTCAFKLLPADFAMKKGDMFELVYSTTFRGLHQLCEDVTADGSGWVADPVSIVPPLRTGAATDDVVRFRLPRCYMAVQPDSIETEALGPLKSRVRWSAVQVHSR